MRLRYVALGFVYSLFVLLTCLSNPFATHVVPVVHSTGNINKKYPTSLSSSHLFGAKGGTSSSFFSVKLLAKKWVECEILFFFVRGLRCWPSSSRATFYKQKVMPGLLSLRNFSSSTHHTRLKCLLIQSGFNIKIIRVQKSVIFRVHLWFETEVRDSHIAGKMYWKISLVVKEITGENIQKMINQH